jgi:hypothetical protein
MHHVQAIVTGQARKIGIVSIALAPYSGFELARFYALWRRQKRAATFDQASVSLDDSTS